MTKDASTPLALVDRPSQTTTENTSGAALRGRWYVVKNGHDDDQGLDTDTVTKESAQGFSIRMEVSQEELDVAEKSGGWLGCVTHVGSNYVEIKGPSPSGGMFVSRVHYDNFWSRCLPVSNPDPILDGKIAKYQGETRSLMNEVHALTAKLGVAPRHEIADGADSEVRAISIRSSEPVEAYKKALVVAEEKTLPDLFRKIKESNQMMSAWMKAKIIPLEAESEALNETVGLVKDRIFSVELYAGLVETAKCVREGKPADNDAQVHLMQRRAYMDEECLVGYEIGGMDYKSIEEFDKWLCKPNNFTRLLPYPKTFIAFQVRRDKKYREASNYAEYIQVLADEAADEATYLYVRNGEQLHRIRTKIEFEEQLFPDTNNKIFTSSKLWANKFLHGIKDVISDEEYQGKLEDYKVEQAKLKKIPEKDRWRSRNHDDPRERYHPFTQDNVYFDDIMEVITAERKKHNRLVLVMQGLLDRSPVLHPHPPWQLWTHQGFTAAFKLIYDGSRALSAGDKPDFEAYHAKLNSYLRTGSVTVGQETPWLRREAERVNRERANNPSHRESDREYTFYKPFGDPGPGKLAIVDRYSENRHACTYKWKRAKRRSYHESAEITATLTTGQENVFNVDAYKPGDFHMFFDDPRTRLEYLRWAPFLLEAEECHAGNRKIEPNKRLPAMAPHKPMILSPEADPRPADLDYKEKPETPPLAEKYVGKKAMIKHSFSTQKGGRFSEGEIVIITSYYRRKIDIKSAKNENKRCHKLEFNWVTVIGD
jgi:hypothetical protein